ncbi:MAG: right-handed parallel beta-helix repeat-containing protein, partial [Planctomycetes bacterium]|nr:right-handed parallel beta-helix repeat-containing protein [Planctomycetota bacterium]
MFVDADGPDDVFGTPDDDFRLLPGSPCIDAGFNETDPNLADTDLAGLPRIINATVDIGAHEFEGIIYVEKPEPHSGSWRNPCLGTEAYPFRYIQSAVDVALNGHTVIVAPGIYSPANHTLTMTGNNIILQSTDPSDPVTASRTIISGTVVFEGAEDPTCVLAGFRVQHNYHGAIYGNTTRATLKHCYLIDNGPCDGSVLVECDGLIRNCLIADNMADGDCGLYPVIYRCSAEFVNCTIANNDSGIHVNNASFENCILYHNVDPNIYVEGRGAVPGSLTLIECCVEGLYHSSRAENPEYPTIVESEGAILNFSHIRLTDPLFVSLGTKSGPYPRGSRSSESSLGDYHLKTPGWRWSPVAFHGSHWVFDQIESPSPCIDAARPDEPLGEELMTIPEDPEGVYSVNRALNFG